MTRLSVLIAAVLLAHRSASVDAQSYRARVDAGAQAVSFRGLVADSIPIASAVPSANGGLQTPDGHAVRCGAGAFCYFMRPGPELRSIPLTTSASIVLWGIGVQGLTLRASGRYLEDLAGDVVWPGAQPPPAQLLEGYLEYQRAAMTARAGRLLVASRLESIGFDGALVRGRWDRAALDFAGYGGWGLGQAAALPVMSPALNPLDEWRPRDRQIVSGAEATWLHRLVDVRVEYRQEIDPEDDNFVSQRTALSFGARATSWRALGGVDYNIAEGQVGSADLTLTYWQQRFSVSGGARRYQPYFSLWTIWGAFSPIPYNAVNATAEVRATSDLSLHVRGEAYRYENADVSTAIVPDLEDRGWRATAGATATIGSQWTVYGNLGAEFGPGAAGRFVDGWVTFSPTVSYSFDLYGGTLARPLELRFYDATTRWIGGRASWQVNAERRLWGDVGLFDDNRDRPDASASSLDQVRLRAGVSLAFGSRGERIPLPPARSTVR